MGKNKNNSRSQDHGKHNLSNNSVVRKRKNVSQVEGAVADQPLPMEGIQNTEEEPKRKKTSKVSSVVVVKNPNLRTEEKTNRTVVLCRPSKMKTRSRSTGKSIVNKTPVCDDSVNVKKVGNNLCQPGFLPNVRSDFNDTDNDVVELHPRENEASAFNLSLDRDEQEDEDDVVKLVDGIQVTVDRQDSEDATEEGEIDDDDVDVDVDNPANLEATVVEVPMPSTSKGLGKGGKPSTIPAGVNDPNYNFDLLRGNPSFENYIKKMVAKEVQNEKKSSQLPRESPLQRLDRKANQDKQKGIGIIINSQPVPLNKQKTPESKINKVIKSPSDTTIYAPALAKNPNNRDKFPVIHTKQKDVVQQLEPVFDSLLLQNHMGDVTESQNQAMDNNTDLANQISHFIEGIRMQDHNEKLETPRVNPGKPVPKNRQGGGDSYNRQLDQAKSKAKQMILDAEKFKASVNSPPGNNILNLSLFDAGLNENMGEQQPQIAVTQMSPLQQGIPEQFPIGTNIMAGQINNAGPRMDVDDDFFHVTCHVEMALKQKIQRGEFVELERLLPKIKNTLGSDPNKLDLVFRDGHSYFVPAVSETKINGVRRWEQAFRVYAAIYSEANPSRAAEIWQYVHIINVASSSYIWENVASYDFTFRQLMAANPQRSWAKIYNQMWNISMRNPIQNNMGTNYQHQRGHSSNNNNYQGKDNRSNNNGQSYKKKPKYCWGFNRGHCKDGAACKFVHRCSNSNCDSESHGKNKCFKK